MITCNKCGQQKEKTEFYPRNHVCKVCYRDRTNTKRRAKKKSDPQWRAEQHKLLEQKAKEGKKIVDDYKIKNGCKCCGLKSSHAQIYDLHHRDPSQKVDKVSNLTISNHQKIRDEIAKCDVLCSNCHRLVHAGVINV